ncbi:hypothetical protein T552_03361 [Pneumocystis carinii B80]|uniref:Karyogamy protein 5 n=1 Tax=Pneumocystis carinii (strain B80) TaxID=1408658 RepID=A0A0W4ZBD5_PNEC8|nr:hypothetical protein T552_03361 [Pneumocystis carinii B80]KTW25748.1 hypothetical protein T552_03361 [Pneumocystis carinii B80]
MIKKTMLRWPFYLGIFGILRGICSSEEDFLLNPENSDILLEIADENELFMPMLETLSLLARKPSCFRSAASSLISQCKEMDSDLYEAEKAAFAVKLTLCELGTAHAEIPAACREKSLEKCVKELETRPQWWTSYSGYFRDVTRMCYVARTEVEKDQLLSLHRNLTQVQMVLLHNLKKELEDIDIRIYDKYKLEHMWQDFQEDMENNMLTMRNEIKEMEKRMNLLLTMFTDSINMSMEDVNKKMYKITTDLDKVAEKVEEEGSHLKKEIKDIGLSSREAWSAAGETVLDSFESIKKINNDLSNIQRNNLDSIVNLLDKIFISLDSSFGSIESLSRKILSTSTVAEIFSKTLENLTYSYNDLFSSMSSIEVLQSKIGNKSLSTIKSMCTLVNETMDGLLDQIQQLKNTTKNAQNHIYSWIFSKIPYALICFIIFFSPMYKSIGISLVFLYYLWRKLITSIEHWNILNLSYWPYTVLNIYKNIICFIIFSASASFFVYFLKKSRKFTQYSIPSFYKVHQELFKIDQKPSWQRLSTTKRTNRISRIF